MPQPLALKDLHRAILTEDQAPLLQMYTPGQDFVPHPIHAGGLRYHAMAPMVSHVVHSGLMEAPAIAQDDAFSAGVLFARTEGLVPAPESTHVIAAAVAETRRCAEQAVEKVIVIGLSGNGQLDLPAYAEYAAPTEGNA